MPGMAAGHPTRSTYDACGHVIRCISRPRATGCWLRSVTMTQPSRTKRREGIGHHDGMAAWQAVAGDVVTTILQAHRSSRPHAPEPQRPISWAIPSCRCGDQHATYRRSLPTGYPPCPIQAHITGHAPSPPPDPMPAPTQPSHSPYPAPSALPRPIDEPPQHLTKLTTTRAGSALMHRRRPIPLPHAHRTYTHTHTHSMHTAPGPAAAEPYDTMYSLMSMHKYIQREHTQTKPHTR